MLDLKTRKYGFINQDKIDKDKDKSSSPDKVHYLSIDQTKIPYKIWLHNPNGKKRIVVNDAGMDLTSCIQVSSLLLKLIG
jgi:hypothetical protein